MGLLDKVKETAQKGADLAKDGVKAGQGKIDTIKLEKKVGDLKQELGGVVYLQQIGTPADDADAEITRLVGEIREADAELSASGEAESEPGPDAS